MRRVTMSTSALTLQLKQIAFKVSKLVQADLVEVDARDGSLGVSAAQNGIFLGYVRGDSAGNLCMPVKDIEVQLPVDHTAHDIPHEIHVDVASPLTFFIQARGCKASAFSAPDSTADAVHQLECMHYQTIAVGSLNLSQLSTLVHRKSLAFAVAGTSGTELLVVEVTCDQNAWQTPLTPLQTQYVKLASPENAYVSMARQLENLVEQRNSDLSSLLVGQYTSNMDDDMRQQNIEILRGLASPRVECSEWNVLLQTELTPDLCANSFRGLQQMSREMPGPLMLDWSVLEHAKTEMLTGEFLAQEYIIEM